MPEIATPDPDESPILREFHKGWVNLVLNRPRQGNSLTPELLKELAIALAEADGDASIHAVLISGSEACPDFCTGYFNSGPVSEGLEENTLDDDIRNVADLQRHVAGIFDLHKPVVVKVHGRCTAGGTDIALLADIVIASDDARFGFPPSRDMGASPCNQWLYHCGPQWAKRLLFTGDLVSASDAALIGLILKAVPRARLDHEVHGLMNRMAKIDRALLATHKRAVNLGMELMGSRSMIRLSGELDARAHFAPSSLEIARQLTGAGASAFNQSIREKRRDTFGPGIARVREPDNFDETGRILAT